MASIRLLEWTNSATYANAVQSTNGLVLGNKEGFYRDLGTDIFTNNDYVRVAIWYSINLNSNYNSSSITNEPVTNSNPYDYFYCGLKTPNANFPDEAQVQSKFCGYYMPPRCYITNSPGGPLQFNGIYYVGGSNPVMGWADSFNNYDQLYFGNLTTPYTQNAIITTNYLNISTNKISHGTGGIASAGSASGIGVLGIELRNDNTMLANYTAKSSLPQGTNGSASIPALSAMKNYVNNQSFLSNSINLAANVPYGQATAMFMYNPLFTHCIRVHGMIAAGFTR